MVYFAHHYNLCAREILYTLYPGKSNPLDNVR